MKFIKYSHLNKNIKIYLLFTFILLGIFSCVKKKSIDEITLNKSGNINGFSDSTFFTDIRSIYATDRFYYISDYNRDQIFKLNRNLDLLRTIGNKGQGPGEFLGAAQLYVDNDTVFAINDNKMSFETFKDSIHLQTINYPPNNRAQSNLRFFVNNGFLYFSSTNENYSICKYNLNSKKNTNFGFVKKFRTNKETCIKNYRHLLIHGSSIIAVPECQPVVELYNPVGKLIKSVDFSDIEPIRTLLNFINKDSQSENSYYVIDADVSIYNNSLFILILTVDKSNKTESNTILKFDILADDIVPKQIIHLGKGWFRTINVSKKCIFSYDALNKELIKFNYETE